MSKQTGLGDRLIVDGIDISGDTGSLSAIGSPRPTTDVTGIDKEAFERIHMLRDGQIDWQSWFNPEGAHDELSVLPTADRIVTYLRGVGIGAPGASMMAKQINYDPTRNADGSISMSINSQANGFGLDWGIQLTPGFRTDTEATDGSGVDHGSSTEFGVQAFIHVLSFTGTDATITVEQASNDTFTADESDVAELEVTTGPVSARFETDRDADGADGGDRGPERQPAHLVGRLTLRGWHEPRHARLR
jgi:hypothetical protein